MKKAALFAILTLCAACGSPDQTSVRTVAAIEIALTNEADRSDLVSILRQHAGPQNGTHVDDVTSRWRDFEAENGPTLPGGRGTIFVGVWYGSNDDEPIADVDDMGHPTRAWLTFAKGKLVAIATSSREAVLIDVARRWPKAREIPILPDGGLPLADDLEMTHRGYKIVASKAPTYDLPLTSPLVAQGHS